MPKLENVAAEYAELWDSATIRPEHLADVTATARRIIEARPRYEEVAAVTGVPWFVIGTIHAMECGLSFAKHLHNGNPLTARTRQVPRGRPLRGSPPFAWSASATDALRYDGLDKLAPWTLEKCAWALEKFNGFGSRARGVPSAYLWSYTNHYTAGKYESDGLWSPTVVSGQSGSMAILMRLGELCPDAALPRERAAVATAQPKARPDVRDTVRHSGTIYGAALKLAGILATWIAAFAGDVPAAIEKAEEIHTLSQRILHLAGVSLPWLGAAAVFAGFAIILQRRISATTEQRIG